MQFFDLRKTHFIKILHGSSITEICDKMSGSRDIQMPICSTHTHSHSTLRVISATASKIPPVLAELDIEEMRQYFLCYTMPATACWDTIALLIITLSTIADAEPLAPVLPFRASRMQEHDGNATYYKHIYTLLDKTPHHASEDVSLLATNKTLT